MPQSYCNDSRLQTQTYFAARSGRITTVPHSTRGLQPSIFPDAPDATTTKAPLHATHPPDASQHSLCQQGGWPKRRQCPKRTNPTTKRQPACGQASQIAQSNSRFPAHNPLAPLKSKTLDASFSTARMTKNDANQKSARFSVYSRTASITSEIESV